MSATDYEKKRHLVRDDVQHQLAKFMLAQYPHYGVTVDLYGVAKVNATVLLDLFNRSAAMSATDHDPHVFLVTQTRWDFSNASEVVEHQDVFMSESAAIQFAVDSGYTTGKVGGTIIGAIRPKDLVWRGEASSTESVTVRRLPLRGTA